MPQAALFGPKLGTVLNASECFSQMYCKAHLGRAYVDSVKEIITLAQENDFFVCGFRDIFTCIFITSLDISVKWRPFIH